MNRLLVLGVLLFGSFQLFAFEENENHFIDDLIYSQAGEANPPKQPRSVLTENAADTPFRLADPIGQRTTYSVELDPVSHVLSHAMTWAYELWVAGTLTVMVSPPQIAYGALSRAVHHRPAQVRCENGEFIYHSQTLLGLVEIFERNRQAIRDAIQIRKSFRRPSASHENEATRMDELTPLELIREYNATLPTAVGMYVRGAFSLEHRRLTFSEKFLTRVFGETLPIPLCEASTARQVMSHLRIEVARERRIVSGRYREALREGRRNLMRNFDTPAYRGE